MWVWRAELSSALVELGGLVGVSGQNVCMQAAVTRQGWLLPALGTAGLVLGCAVTGVGTSWRGTGTTFSFICFVISTVPRRPVPRQGVFGGIMCVWIEFGSLSTLKQLLDMSEQPSEYLGSRGESWGQHAHKCWTRRLCHSPKDAEGGQWGWSDEEGPACGVVMFFFAGSWVAVTPAGSWGCAVFCQLLSCLIVWSQMQPHGIFSIPKVAWQEGRASCSAFHPVSPGGLGDTARAGGILGVLREEWRLGAHLGAQSGAHSHLSHIYSTEPARGEAGGGGGG